MKTTNVPVRSLSARQLLERLESITLPAWLTKLLQAGPVSGGKGCHGWLYDAGKGLYYYRHRHRFTDEDIFTLLRAKADGYGRLVPDSEIYDVIESAVRDANHSNNKSRAGKHSWPEPEYEGVNKIVTAGIGLKELREASPVNTLRDPVTSDQVVSRLFSGDSGDPFVCAAINEKLPITKPLSHWLNGQAWLNERLGQQSFIVSTVALLALATTSWRSRLRSAALADTKAPKLASTDRWQSLN